jgi:hypothetical protein
MPPAVAVSEPRWPARAQGLDANAAATLAGALGLNRSVTELNAGWNAVGDAGAAALAAALADAAVTTVDLRANKIGPSGASAARNAA